MKLAMTAVAAALTLTGSAAFAGGGDFTDYARVIEVQPQYQSVDVPRKDCYSEYVPESHYTPGGLNLAGSLLGGVAGGLLGSRFGGGDGRVASAAVGAVAGAIVGDRIAGREPAREEYYEREVRRCRLVDNWESRITGYRVAYEYQGRNYSTMLPYDPGARLPVHVSVDPAIEGR